MADINKSRVYFLPLYAAGHLISMVELAKNLLQCNSTSTNSFSIHFLLMQPNNPDKASPISHSYLQSLQAQNLQIHFHPLPFIEPPNRFDGFEDFITIYMRLYFPHIKSALSASPSPISGLIVDMFATDAIDVAKELNIPSYIYFTSTATFLSLLLHISSPQVQNDQVDFSEVEEICVPGLTPIPSISMPSALLHRKSASYKTFVYHTHRCMEAKGIIINSNVHIETKAVEALAHGIVTQLTPGKIFPEMYPIGPVISFGENNGKEHECLKWLDKQPAKSVVFLCFGSNAAFEVSQVRQIATGLEQSGHRFLWVLRQLSKEIFLRGPTDANLEELLEEGFLERTSEMGMVWASWAPQNRILSHRAIGGFVTHCGWNSILESLWFGVPMIPLPIYAEQHLNAFQLVNEMHVAVALEFDKKNEGSFVTATELERAIKRLMDAGSVDGRKVRDRAEEMKLACRKAVQREGVSYVHLQKLVGELDIQGMKCACCLEDGNILN